jgi:flagellar M-ring protein FliF
MDVLKRAADQIKTLWAGLTPARRVVLAAALAAIVLLVVWGSSAAGGNGMAKVAGAEMRDDERAQIVRKLKERNQLFDVRNGEIYLPAADAERVMFELNADGVFSDDTFYKYVLESNILDTGADKERKFQLGLQKKLERMIRNVKGVKNAAVQVTPQVESERFFKDAPKAGASVQVDLHPGHSLSGENVNAVAGLVARAVRGLDPDRVHIMDTAGRVYRVRKSDDSARSAADIRDIEIQYEDRIKADIQQILPEARVVVRFELQLSETRSEDITHKNPVAQSEEDRRVDGAGSAVPAVSGIKGGSDPVESAVESGPSKPRERETKVVYAVGKKTEVVHTPAGAVQRITVGVLIPVREGDLERERQNEAKYKSLIMKAAGPKADENSVSLMFVPTRPPAPLPVPTFWDEAGEALSSRGASTVGIVLLALVVLWILYAVLRRAMPKGVVEDLQTFQARLSEEAALLPAPGVPLGEADVARVRGGLKDMAARNPRAIAGILKRWLAGK